MCSEADYLRGELIAAKGLLAEALGIMAAADSISPQLARIPTVRNFVVAAEKFQTRGVAVLPEGVSRA